MRSIWHDYQLLLTSWPTLISVFPVPDPGPISSCTAILDTGASRDVVRDILYVSKINEESISVTPTLYYRSRHTTTSNGTLPLSVWDDWQGRSNWPERTAHRNADDSILLTTNQKSNRMTNLRYKRTNVIRPNFCNVVEVVQFYGFNFEAFVKNCAF